MILRAIAAFGYLAAFTVAGLFLQEVHGTEDARVNRRIREYAEPRDTRPRASYSLAQMARDLAQFKGNGTTPEQAMSMLTGKRRDASDTGDYGPI